MTKIKMGKEEIKIIADIQKKIIEAIAENMHLIKGEERQFQIISNVFSISICNLLHTFNVNDKDRISSYMEYLSSMIINGYDIIKDKSSCMIYYKGKKISEGKSN